jgi:3-oxoadipate enol-lactonase
MPVARLADIEVRYEERGDSPHCVVFSHGFLMDHAMFEPQLDALAGDYRCVVWDERGHGDTRATGFFTYWDSARDLWDLLDHLGVDEAALVGMSQGGFLSLRAALLAPGRVRGLALIDSQAGPEEEAVRPAYDALFQDWLANGLSDGIAQTVAAAILGPADAAPWIAKWRAMTPEDVGPAFGALMEREDIHDRLGEITCPALVIHGIADAAIPMEKAEALCRGLAGCDGVVAIEGAGHASNLSHPAAVNAALQGFLPGLWHA